MASEKLASIPEVEIDADGTFKYVLIKVYGVKGSTSPDEVKTIVRGFKWGEYHGKKQNPVLNQFFVFVTGWWSFALMWEVWFGLWFI
jgi:hypothetical protein